MTNATPNYSRGTFVKVRFAPKENSNYMVAATMKGILVPAVPQVTTVTMTAAHLKVCAASN